ECPLWVKSRHGNRSAQCPLYPQKRTLIERVRMSALCHKRTSVASFDHIVSATEQQRWHVEVHRLGGLEIDDQFKLCRRLDREVGRLLALEDAVDVLWHLAKLFDKISTKGDQAA